jgi:formylglycine-generating enzyme required for sulfatase activity
MKNAMIRILITYVNIHIYIHTTCSGVGIGRSRRKKPSAAERASVWGAHCRDRVGREHVFVLRSPGMRVCIYTCVCTMLHTYSHLLLIYLSQTHTHTRTRTRTRTRTLQLVPVPAGSFHMGTKVPVIPSDKEHAWTPWTNFDFGRSVCVCVCAFVCICMHLCV